MGFSFFPRSVKFFDLFKEQNEKLMTAGTVLCELFEAFCEAEEHCKRINLIESEGNAVRRHIAKELSTTFITPIDREDILEINIAQEDILNLIKAVSTRVGVFEPPRPRYPAKRLARLLRNMIEEAGVILRALADKKTAEANVENIRLLKYECETLLLVGIGELYDADQREPVAILDVVKWSQIYDRIEAAVERAESLGEILEGVMLKNA